MKKVISVLLALSLLLVLAACGSSNPSNGAKTYKIGICNYVDDSSLNQIVEKNGGAAAAPEAAEAAAEAPAAE